MITGKPETIREINETLILETLRKKGPMSRANLKKALNLSFPTISANVKNLIESNWIIETEKDGNALGRKATLLEYNAKKGYVVGIDVGRSHITALLADLTGKEVAACLKKGAWRYGKDVISDVISSVYEVINKAGIRQQDILSMAIGVPGIYDNKKEVNRLAPFIEGWETVKLDRIVSDTFKIPVMIDNSVNFGAIEEKWHGVAQGYSNILYLSYGVGIGGALILNGKLFRGTHGAAGEIGYSLPQYSLKRDNYNEEGLYEQLLSRHTGYGSETTDISRPMKKIFDDAVEGDKLSLEILHSFMEYTSVVLTTSISLLNPEIVVFSGGMGVPLFERFKDEFREILKNHIPYVPILAASRLGQSANAWGAAGVALRYIHNDYRNASDGQAEF